VVYDKRRVIGRPGLVHCPCKTTQFPCYRLELSILWYLVQANWNPEANRYAMNLIELAFFFFSRPYVYERTVRSDVKNPSRPIAPRISSSVPWDMTDHQSWGGPIWMQSGLFLDIRLGYSRQNYPQSNITSAIMGPFLEPSVRSQHDSFGNFHSTILQ